MRVGAEVHGDRSAEESETVSISFKLKKEESLLCYGKGTAAALPVLAATAAAAATTTAKPGV